MVTHEKGAVVCAAGVDVAQETLYSEQVALERATVKWFVMVCACSLRTQQCAEMLVPCFFVLFFCCASVWLVISAAPVFVVGVVFC